MNGFLSEIGEKRLDDEAWERLCMAVRDERLTFFLARRGCRAVGMVPSKPVLFYLYL